MAKYYPAFLKLEGRRCVVVGGGGVALRKTTALVSCGALVKVVSPDLSQELMELAQNGIVEWRQGAFCEPDLEGAFLAVAATGDPETNRHVAQAAKSRGVLVNVVTAPRLSDFIVPASLRRGSLSISICTDGKSPLLARVIRDELAAMYGEQYSEFVELAGKLRRKLLTEGSAEKTARELLATAVSPEIIELVRNGRMQEVRRRLARLGEPGARR